MVPAGMAPPVKGTVAAVPSSFQKLMVKGAVNASVLTGMMVVCHPPPKARCEMVLVAAGDGGTESMDVKARPLNRIPKAQLGTLEFNSMTPRTSPVALSGLARIARCECL